MAIAVLLVILPTACVFRAISMKIISMAMRLAVDPVYLLDVTLCVDEPASSIRFALLPVPLIDCSIRPGLQTTAVFEAFLVCLALVRDPLVETFLDWLI